MNKHNHSHHSHHTKERKRLSRWQKNLIHGGLLVLIAASLWYEGAKSADVGFFFLSVATEVS